MEFFLLLFFDRLRKSDLPDFAELLGDGEENLIVLFLDELLQVRKERAAGLSDTNGQDDSLEAMDGVNLEVDFLSSHFFLQELEGVNVFHFCLNRSKQNHGQLNFITVPKL